MVRRIALVSLLLACSMAGFAEKSGTILVQDRAVFRVETRPYFVSELNPILNSYGRFRCLKKSFLVGHMEKNNLRNQAPLDFGPLPLDLEELRKRESEVQLLLTLLKIRNFIPGTSVSFNPELLVSLNFKSCYKAVSDLNEIEKELLYLEVYLRNRFISRSKNRQTESLNSFLETVLKKVNYELYY